MSYCESLIRSVLSAHCLLLSDAPRKTHTRIIKRFELLLPTLSKAREELRRVVKCFPVHGAEALQNYTAGVMKPRMETPTTDASLLK